MLALVLLDSVDRRNVRVLQRSQEFRLTLEAREPLGVLFELLGQRLDGDVTIEPRVACAIHFSHAAFAKKGSDFVWAALLSNTDRHEDGHDYSRPLHSQQWHAVRERTNISATPV